MTARPSARPRRTLVVSILVTALRLLLPIPAQAAPPGNDAFADAIAVAEPLPFTDAQDTSEATLEEEEPALGDECGFGVDHTVWYSYSPGADGIVSVNTFGSDFDTVLGVWEGTDLGALTLVGCNDDRRDLQSSVVFFAEMAAEYRIQVGGFGGATGNLEVKVRATAGGVVEGVVTDEDTSDPIAGACVLVQDAAGFDNGGFTVTDDTGDYRVALRPGEYVVQFIDCERDAYIPEYYDDVTEEADATEIEIAADDVVTGIDAALAPGCPGWASFPGNQILGTPGPDELAGTADRDVICGFGDVDDLTGGQGRDILIGGAGDDALRGAADADEIFGGTGRDSLFGGLGRDLLDGDAGRDRCNGGAGDDRLRSCEIRVGG